MYLCAHVIRTTIIYISLVYDHVCTVYIYAPNTSLIHKCTYVYMYTLYTVYTIVLYTPVYMCMYRCVATVASLVTSQRPSRSSHIAYYRCFILIIHNIHYYSIIL